MKKIPITCRIFKAIGRKSPSGIFAGCKIGKIPGGGCVGCPEYEPFCEFIEKENPMEEKEIHCSCGKLLAKRHSDGKIYVWCKECRKEVELEVEPYEPKNKGTGSV